MRFEFQGADSVWKSSMGGHDLVVMQAIKNFLERHPANDRWTLPAHERTRAIYDEIKRLDAKEMLPRRRVEKPADEMA
jgi:hypothetical protein